MNKRTTEMNDAIQRQIAATAGRHRMLERALEPLAALRVHLPKFADPDDADPHMEVEVSYRAIHAAAAALGLKTDFDATVHRTAVVDLVEEAIADSMDVDWTYHVGARQVVDRLIRAGLIVAAVDNGGGGQG